MGKQSCNCNLAVFSKLQCNLAKCKKISRDPNLVLAQYGPGSNEKFNSRKKLFDVKSSLLKRLPLNGFKFVILQNIFSFLCKPFKKTSIVAYFIFSFIAVYDYCGVK